MHMYMHILLYVVAEAIQMSLMAQSFRTVCMNANNTSSSTPLQLLLSPLPAGQGWLLLLVISPQSSHRQNGWQPTVEFDHPTENMCVLYEKASEVPATY